MPRKKMIRLEDLNKPWQDQRDANVSVSIKVTPKTDNHAAYLRAIETDTIVLNLGPSGSGKTWMACGKAIELLNSGRVERIILSRPLVTCGEDPGYLPGDLNEKVGPFMQPLLDSIADFIDPKEVEKLIAHGIIEFVPLAFMQGRTFKKAFVILDEAQNATLEQLHMFLTRFGTNAKVVITGSISQTNIRHDGTVPLVKMIEMFRGRHDFDKQPIAVVYFDRADIVRHPLIQWIDETFTGEFVETDAPSSVEAACNIKCPECQETLWYENTPEYVKCWRCASLIELYDDDDELEPLLVDNDATDTYTETFPISP